jgi:hypothetical protein
MPRFSPMPKPFFMFSMSSRAAGQKEINHYQKHHAKVHDVHAIPQVDLLNGMEIHKSLDIEQSF